MRARSRRLGDLGELREPRELRELGELREIDLNDVAAGDGYLFVRNGVGVAGRGVVRRLGLDEVTAALASIHHTNETGWDHVAPVAIGTIDFVPGHGASFVIPRTVVGKDTDGNVWITSITHDADADADADAGSVSREIGGHFRGEASDLAGDLAPRATPRPTTATYEVGPGVDPQVFLDAVLIGRDAVARGELTKVVLARDLIVRSSQPIDVHALLRRLRLTFASSYRYSIDGLVGASPELLVSREGNVVRSHPLAGTTSRTGDPEIDDQLARELIASIKNQIEHRVVIDMVHDTLLPWCSYLDEEPEPSVVKVANVQHLGTAMEGRLSSPAPSVLEMAVALCPTPALGGHPRDQALALIAAFEGMDRGRYGGAVGWVDANGNGTFAVTIRCAEITGSSARLFAGCGIVADSDPYAELAETQAKFQAMLGAIVRP